MPLICEVCGSVEESAEMTVNEHLHICADCIKDRHHSELPEASMLEEEN